MWIIRKISPWQDQNRFYEIGNPVVFSSNDKDEVIIKKRELEIFAVKTNPLPNFFEYWDVVCDKELIRLHNLLLRKFQFKILKFDDEISERELENDDVLHGVYPDKRFSDADLIEIQDFVNRYYYKIDEIKNPGYILVFDPDFEMDLLYELKFKIFETEKEAISVKETLPHQELIRIEAIK